MNDQLLIEKAKKGKLSAFELIVKNHQRAIFRHTLRILKDHDKAADATQDTFIKAYKNISKFKKGKPIKPWIYKIATNTCYDIIKKDSRVSRLDIEIKSENDAPIERIIKKEQVKNLLLALKKLPDKYKTPITGFYFDRLSYKELADNLNLPINTLKTRIRRGKLILRKELIYQ